MTEILVNDELEVKEEMNDPEVISGKIREHDERLDLAEKKITEDSDDLGRIKQEIQDFKDTLPIADGELAELKQLGATIVHSMLGDNDSEDYQAHHMIFFGHLWRDFRREYSLSKVAKLPHKLFQEGMDFVLSWEPDEGVQGLMDEHDRAMTQKKAHDLKIFLQAAEKIRREAGKKDDTN